MKKLLTIMVLGLLLSGCGDSGEKIVLDCKGVSKSVDGKGSVNNFDHTIIIDLNKKTWKMIAMIIALQSIIFIPK